MKTIFLSALIIACLIWRVYTWDKKRRKDKQAKVVQMDIEEFEFDSYHKN